jgi:hypothetical protein
LERFDSTRASVSARPRSVPPPTDLSINQSIARADDVVRMRDVIDRDIVIDRSVVWFQETMHRSTSIVFIDRDPGYRSIDACVRETRDIDG